MAFELSEQEQLRRNSLAQLRALGIDPYPAAEYPTNAFSTGIKENFTDLPLMKNEEGEEVPHGHGEHFVEFRIQRGHLLD